MTKNILQVVQHLRPGGIETMALELQKHLPQSNVHIVSLEGLLSQSVIHWPRLKNNINHIHFLDKQPGFRLGTLLKLIHLIKKLKITAVHTHHIGPLTYGGIAARLSGIKSLVHTEHDAWHLEDYKVAKLERNLVSWLRPKVVADCQIVEEKLVTVLKSVNPSVILNGVDVSRFCLVTPNEKQTARRKLNLSTTRKIIGCAARLEDVKGVKYLIEAFDMISEDCDLVIAGSGSKETILKAQADTTNACKNIKFLGRIEDMPNFYKALDVFCLPSLNEGFPLSPLEAQACGIPVVLTDVGGAKETLCPHSGSLVPASNATALASSLSSKLQEKSIKTPRDFILETATLEKMCSSYDTLLTV